jgi:glycosyltransferase involved in cell wall biosynthesis
MKYGLVYRPGVWEHGMGKNSPVRRMCLVPKVSGVGGMVSFKSRLIQGLAERGIAVTDDLMDTPFESVLIIGGTRNLAGIWRAKRRGVSIIQRLDGMNWIHRKRRTGWRHYLRAEYGNFILSVIRSRLANQIIYQSEFSHQWWERVYGKNHTPWHVVHNGVDLERYSPQGPGMVPADRVRILLVEGTIGGGYELGLQTAVQMSERLQSTTSRNIEVMVAGKITASVSKPWTVKDGIQITLTGQVPIEKIPELDRSAHILYAADINPACPNSVIEALACSLPVAGFDTGALGEIVTEGSGELVPYGGDPWKLDIPDIPSLTKAIERILNNQATYREAARKRAEAGFGLDRMVEGYLEVFNL